MTTNDPVLPYGGDADPNSGFAAGVTTSSERAHREDADGTTGKRQNLTLTLMEYPWGNLGRTKGVTWKDLAGVYGWHHGQASSVLSGLHKAGKIARLTERRDRCFIYVLPEYVNGRDTQTQGRNQKTRYTRADMAEAWAVGYDAGWADCDEDTSLGNVNPYLGGGS